MTIDLINAELQSRVYLLRPTMLIYILPAALVYIIVTSALFQDPSTPNNDFESWMLIVLASFLWPLTLPSILQKKYLD